MRDCGGGGDSASGTGGDRPRAGRGGLAQRRECTVGFPRATGGGGGAPLAGGDKRSLAGFDEWHQKLFRETLCAGRKLATFKNRNYETITF